MTLWTAAHQTSLTITNSWSLLKLVSIESVMPSNHLILCCPLLLPPSIFLSIRVFSSESALCIRWPKYWSFSFSISPSYELLLLLSHFSRVFLCVIPQTAAHQAPPVPGILQAKTLEWVAISFSNVWKVKSLSRVWLLATPWTAAYQAPPSMGFSRQEYWSGVPLPSPFLWTLRTDLL